MAKITDYPKVAELLENNVFLLDGENGTKGILAGDMAKALLSLMTTKEIMDNINIADLDSANSLEGTDSLLIGTADGNRKISVSDIIYTILDPEIPMELRRNLWRGKNLGSVVTDAQYEEINAGTFRDLFIGDYWEIGGRIWRIVDIDYWFNTGENINNVCRTHHLVIMPDLSLGSGVMYTNTAGGTGGYIGSNIYKNVLPTVKTIVNGAFTEQHILVHREWLTNANDNKEITGNIWVNSTVEVPNEIMIYGTYIFGQVSGTHHTVCKTQLAATKIHPSHIYNNEGYWMRNFVRADIWSTVGNFAVASAGYGWKVNNVRPVFGLKK